MSHTNYKTERAKRRKSHLVGTLLAVVLLLACADVAESANVIGVTGLVQNGGVGNTIFEVDVDTGALTALGTTSVQPNSIAWNHKNLLYYGEHTGTDLYAFNTDTLSNSFIADLTSIAGTGDMLASEYLSGGAAYDASSMRYYFAPEDVVSGEAGTDIHWLEFDAAGTAVVNSGRITPDLSNTAGKTTLGNFGDLAVSEDGYLYGASDDVNTSLPNSLNRFWRIDLDDPLFTVELIGPEFTGPSPQIAFDQDGELWANFFNDGTMFRVNKLTGALSDEVTLGSGADFFDMASTFTTPPSSTPEPSSLVLAGLALLPLLIRRRRR